MQPEVRRISDLDEMSGDLAGKHTISRSTGYENIPQEQLDQNFEKLMTNGYVVFERVMDGAQLNGLRAAAEKHLGNTGRNTFEGALTQRCYDVLTKTRALDALAENPFVLAMLDRILMPNYLLSQAQIINILPNEVAQLLHFDDASYPIARPRPPLGAASILAIDDFTAENGATVIVPGSHKWDDRRPKPEEAVPCVMPAGSIVFFLGTLWHGGGANQTSKPRLAATCQYCEPWLRQQENFLLEVPGAVAKGLSENLLRMIGYSIHPPFYGMVNGMHPKRLLE